MLLSVLSGALYVSASVIGFREAPTEMSPLLFGHFPFGGGGLDPCQDGLGHLFREELSKFKWAFA